MVTRMSLLLLAGLVLAASSAMAVPYGLRVQGVLSNAGGPVTGPETLHVRLWSASTGGEVLHDETIEVDVDAGVFDLVLGDDALDPLLPEVLADASGVWLGIAPLAQGGPEEELPREPIHAVAYAYVALHAEEAEHAAVADVAKDLVCSGCVTMSELDLDLRTAILESGSVQVSDLPADGLAKVSNGTLSNSLLRTYGAASLPKPIGSFVDVLVDVATGGALTSLSVYVALSHPFHTDLRVFIAPPGAAMVSLVPPVLLSGQGTLTKTFSAPADDAGALAQFLGTDPKGTWTIRIADAIANGNEATGLVTGASITVGYLASEEVEVRATMNLTNHQLQNARLHVSAGPPSPCGPTTQGLIFLDTTDARVKVCVGAAFVGLNSACGDGNVQSPEGCDDSGTADGDGCSATCQAEFGWNCAGFPKSTCTKKLCENGIVFDGICLRSSIISGSADSIPNGCNAYRPARSWSQADFQAICQQFNQVLGRSVGCTTHDTDADGGRCNNYAAIASWEASEGQKGTPDVWVHQDSFSWSPTASAPQCKLASDTETVAIYACQ